MDPKFKNPFQPAMTARGNRGESWLDKVIRAGMAVADGKVSDWAVIERLSLRPRQRAELRELQQIEKIAQHCRAAQAESGPNLMGPGDLTSSWLDMLTAIEQRQLLPQFAADELIGNRYRVKSLLGQGGMGAVYEAWDGELSIPVALKILRFNAGRERDALWSLKQEAMLARAVVHPNICRVYDIGCHGEPLDGVWFLTMEVLRGETLAQRLRQRGRLAPSEAWPLVAQMAAGLDAAHQSGVVHLDFKSSNVMLLGDVGNEQAVITDFGLARAGATVRRGSPGYETGHRGDRRDGGLHVAGAGARPGGRAGGGHLFARGRALRDGDGDSAVHRRHRTRDRQSAARGGGALAAERRSGAR